jgi:hypothetical protein
MMLLDGAERIATRPVWLGLLALITTVTMCATVVLLVECGGGCRADLLVFEYEFE